MHRTRGCLSRLFCVIILSFSFGLPNLSAQDQELADIQYKEDYDRVQEIIKVSQPLQRAMKLLELYQDRRDLNSRLRYYVDSIFAKDLESLMKQNNYTALEKICTRTIEVRPKFGEAYFFYAIVLRRDKKTDEAMDAFAKCYVIKNSFQKKAKQLLDIMYRDIHKGSLVGEEKIIERAKKELG